MNFIEEFKDVIENKRTDITSNQKKNLGKITEKYKSSAETKRKKSQLIDLYKRMKIKARKVITNYNKEIKKKWIANFIPGDFQEFYNKFDDDSNAATETPSNKKQ